MPKSLILFSFALQRNARVFRGIESTPMALLQQIKPEGEDYISAGANHLGYLFSEWSVTNCNTYPWMHVIAHKGQASKVLARVVKHFGNAIV